MMDYVNYLMAHPIGMLLMAAALLLFVYFILKQLLKLALICGLVLIGIGGYHYFKAPSEFPAKAEKAVDQVTDTTRGVFEQGRAVLDKSRDIADKVIEKAEKERKQSSEE